MAKQFDKSFAHSRRTPTKHLLLSFCFIMAVGACHADRPALTTVVKPLIKTTSKPDSRSEWRNLLGWNDDCEQSFSSTQAGDDKGVENYALSKNDNLVIVMCAVGSYQPSFLLYLLNGSASKALVLETYTTTDGRNLARSSEKELWGEPVFLDKTKELVILTVARQTADCGTWAKYRLTPDTARLRDFRFKLPCPAVMSKAVNPAFGNPPRRWKRLKHK